jgi:probable rRNA maturation factor
VTISIKNRLAGPRISNAALRFYVREICRALGCATRGVLPELSVVMTGDARIRALNRDWRQKDRATDVLSFSQVEGDHMIGAGGTLPEHQPVWGDIVISYDTAARQASAHGHSLAAEVKVLLVHGILHLLGHDHERGGAQAARMQAAEGQLLRAVAAARRRQRRRRTR